MRTAFLGPRGTYSEQAALEFAGTGSEMVEVPNFAAAVTAVEEGRAEYAVVPVENAIEGPVSQSLDILIHDTDLKLFAEIVVPIQHVLVGVDGTNLAQVTHVHSHPQALAQCGKWLDANLPNAERVAAMSTSGAVQSVVEVGDATSVAIGPERAQVIYGGEVLARDIQDAPNNRTRFMALARHDAAPTGKDKTFIVMRLDKNLPGSLHKALVPFAKANVQLTNIITRPTKDLLGEYYFLIDLEGHRTEPHISAALDEMRATTEQLKVIGSCPQYDLKME
jgi:prephenate dehydratase